MNNTQARDARIARALERRIDDIDAEMLELEEQRQEFYRLADACLDHIDELADQRFRLNYALWEVDLRQAHAAFRQCPVVAAFWQSVEAAP